MSFVGLRKERNWDSTVRWETRQRTGGFGFRIPAAAGGI